MAILELAAIAMLAQGPAQAVAGSLGQDELMAGRDRAAIAQIELNSQLDANDPARLINLGIARARTGDYDQARKLFEAVVAHEQRLELETADGEWVDSRHLARKAIKMLDRGEFARYFAVSMR